MGLHQVGRVCVVIHCGSRGLGHQVATDYLQMFEAGMKVVGMVLPDRHVACAPVGSTEGHAYFQAMNAAGNFAFCNRSVLAVWVPLLCVWSWDVDGADHDDLRRAFDLAIARRRGLHVIPRAGLHARTVRVGRAHQKCENRQRRQVAKRNHSKGHLMRRNVLRHMRHRETDGQTAFLSSILTWR